MGAAGGRGARSARVAEAVIVVACMVPPWHQSGFDGADRTLGFDARQQGFDAMDAMQLLDAWKKARKIASDAEAGRQLGLTPQAVSNWRRGISKPTPDAVEQMARETGIDWRAAVLEVLAQQSKPDTARTLRRLAQTLAVCLLAFAGVITPRPALSNSGGSELDIFGTGYTLCAILRALRDALSQRFARIKPRPAY